MAFIKQTFENGDIFFPFIMNYMENAIDSDLLVVKVQLDTHTADIDYDIVRQAILDGRLVIYMFYDSDGNIEEFLPEINTQDYIKIIGMTIPDRAYYKHLEDNTIQYDDSHVIN